MNITQTSLINLSNYIIEEEKNENEFLLENINDKIQKILSQLKEEKVGLYESWLHNKTITKLELLKFEQIDFKPKAFVRKIQRINGYIQSISTQLSLNVTDSNDKVYQKLCPHLIGIFKYAKAKMVLGDFGMAAHKLTIEEDPEIFNCLPRFVLLEILASSKKTLLMKIYQEEMVSILKNRASLLATCSYNDYLKAGQDISDNIIPDFIFLSNEFNTLCSEINWKGLSEIETEAIYQSLAHPDSSDFSILEKYAHILKLIRSLSQFLISYHREAFCSLMTAGSVYSDQVMKILSLHGEVEKDDIETLNISIPDFEEDDMLFNQVGQSNIINNIHPELKELAIFGGKTI